MPSSAVAGQTSRPAHRETGVRQGLLQLLGRPPGGCSRGYAIGGVNHQGNDIAFSALPQGERPGDKGVANHSRPAKKVPPVHVSAAIHHDQTTSSRG
jgi:hypothetical protein